jgi:hypothetical protein
MSGLFFVAINDLTKGGRARLEWQKQGPIPVGARP